MLFMLKHNGSGLRRRGASLLPCTAFPYLGYSLPLPGLGGIAYDLADRPKAMRRCKALTVETVVLQPVELTEAWMAFCATVG